MSEINATPATEAAASDTQDFLSSVGESEKRVRVSGKAVSDEVVLSTKDVNVYYGDHHALHNTSLDFHKGEITALIGPSGCGKSTFLRSLNLMNREIRGCRVEGEINYRGRNVNTKAENTYELRRSIGMVFQQPNPFRKSIRDNITFAPKRHGITDRDELDRMVEESLRGAALWDEVKDKLDKSAYALSGGQQQRLCIARTLALNPDVILFDEPCSALDPISTLAIEDLMSSIVANRAIVIVTHNMEQASRVSNRTAFFYMGDMVEYDETDEIFQRPKDKRLNDYLTGMKVSNMDDLVEESLRGAALWDEVKDKLKQSAYGLSGGQQQRLCIARTIAVKPEVILMDEPCSALDPISTFAIEELIQELKQEYTIVIVTHNMQQASRVSDKTAFFNIAGTGKPGKLIEYNTTDAIFTTPSVQATEDYVSGRFG